MSKTLFAVSALLLFALTVPVAAQQSGWMSRYWDGCKPSCSWKDKTFFGGVGICKECDKNDLPLSPPGPSIHDNNESSCGQGGPAYTCWDMIPFPSATDPNLAYGFAATPSDQCGMCFELTFDGGFKHGTPNGTHEAVRGKKLIVMGSNMGGDVGEGQFDLLLPGGGLGQYDSFTGQTGININSLGERYGGFFNACQNEVAERVGWMGDYWKEYKPCLTEKCESVFKDFPMLKQGCLFHANWLEAVNNPTITYKTVECPQLLKDIYSGAAPGGIDPAAIPTTHTLTLAADPPEAGIVVPYAYDIDGPSYPNIVSGEPFAIKAVANDGYTFETWIVTVGEAVIDRADSAVANVTLSSDAKVTASFVQEQVGVKRGSVKAASGRAKVSLTPARRGFAAVLQSGHGYTGYSLIDLRGREIRSGKIGAGVKNLQFGNLSRGVVFLRLSGAGGAPVVLRAVTY